MDLEKLEKMAKLFLNETPYGHSLLVYNSAFAVKFGNLMQVASHVLPDHQALFISAVSKINSSFTLSDAVSITKRLLDILETEKYRARQTLKIKI
jgi:hypothetical protein